MPEASSEKNIDRPTLEEGIREFILDQSFPCVGAKSAVQKGRMTVYVARSIESSWDDVAIQERLMRFAWDYTQEPALFTSFAVVFEGPAGLSEEEFESSLWDRVQSLTDKDAWLGIRTMTLGSAPTRTILISRSASADRRSSSSAFIPRPAGRRAVFRIRRWSSTCMTSSRCCAARTAMRNCGRPFSTAT